MNTTENNLSELSKSCQYSVTVNYVREFKIMNRKSDFKAFFYNVCERFVICRENYLDRDDFHFHIFLHFDLPRSISEIYEVLVNWLDFDQEVVRSVDQKQRPLLWVAKCTSMHNYLNYITQEDVDPEYFGVEVNKYFSLNYRIHHWVRNQPVLNRDHSFYITHLRDSAKIEACWHKYWDDKQQLVPLSAVSIQRSIYIKFI